ncbi:hypothetical protein C2S53_009654 [Perilla frutescens var. hirtella]|uniref:EF-hand domain-containing protein n=1 Tax=Perilla frutescens var. hirtella TaxID=608512 RepID=A0AAD4JH30_PERFH|nr:hypothetical protein C2S53_009654 [Perilla frutescens var. hirtella]
MEQIREVAMAYYTGSTAEKKQLAREFFSLLDGDGDGRVSLSEYKSLLRSFNFGDKLFEKIDENGDGTLDFEEVLTLYYMARIGIRNCDGCGNFLLGSYFSCMLCEKDCPYDLCCACYGGGKFHHHHPTDNFLDDRSTRLLLIHFLQQADDKPELSSSQRDPPSPKPITRHNSYSSREENVKTAFEAFETGVSVGNAVATIGTLAIQTGCSVM